MAAIASEPEPEPEPEPEAAPAASGQGICAIVQFAYDVSASCPQVGYRWLMRTQAQEDNEMDLVEGELIEQIEQLDEGWWSGVGAGGAKQGLFPGALHLLILVLSLRRLVWC